MAMRAIQAIRFCVSGFRSIDFADDDTLYFYFVTGDGCKMWISLLRCALVEMTKQELSVFSALEVAVANADQVQQAV